MKFYIGFFLWPIIIAATIWLNWYRIEKRHLKPNYFPSNWSRGIFGFVCLALMVPKFDPLGSWRSWIEAAPAIVYIVSSFYLFFDAGLNGLRHLRWDYKGEYSGWFDSMKIAAYHVFKVVCLVALITSIIILWQNLN